MNDDSKAAPDRNAGQVPPVMPRRSVDPSSRRGRLFLGFGALIVLGAGGYFLYDVFYASQRVFTNNAYVGADIAPITPLIGASVMEVLVADTQDVKRGDILVRLDDTDYKLQLAMAEATYQSALRRVRSLVATDRNLKAQAAARAADMTRAAAQLTAARADADKSRVDLGRRKTLVAKGSVSGDELTAAETAFRVSEANLVGAQAAQEAAAGARDAALAGRDANAELFEGASVEDNPDVLAARTARDQAAVNLERAVIRAPVDGVVSRRQAQVGQRVQPGMTLMVIVPLAEAYVDANFKEGQLPKVRSGQKVTLRSDLYGDDVVFHGRVSGFSGGTGSAFSVVPAQNATGNWIKVVQRLPVRIALDPAELKAHPLAVGLSMTAEIRLAD